MTCESDFTLCVTATPRALPGGMAHSATIVAHSIARQLQASPWPGASPTQRKAHSPPSIEPSPWPLALIKTPKTSAICYVFGF